jgi:solute carrier family 30 (zinc transporter), member 2
MAHDGCLGDHVDGHHHHPAHPTVTAATENDVNNSTAIDQRMNAAASVLWRDNEKRNSFHFLDHEHGQDNTVLRKLIQASILCCLFLVVEVIGGYVAGSLAVLSDAAHLFADLASFGVAIAASYLGSLPVTEQHTFGLKRMESLAALFSMTCLAAVSVGLAVEAIRRLVQRDNDDAASNDINGKLMSEIAFIGVLVNLALAWVLGEHHVHLPSDTDHGHDHSHAHHGSSQDSDHVAAASSEQQQQQPIVSSHQQVRVWYNPATYSNKNCSHDHSHDHDVEQQSTPHTESTPLVAAAAAAATSDTPDSGWNELPFSPKNINLQAAYLHVLGDLAQSVAVLIAGLVIYVQPGWWAVDPICTLAFCALVFYSTLGVLRTSIAVLLQQVPSHLDWNRIFDRIAAVKGVDNVHELHIWSISHNVPTLSVHCTASDPQTALEDIYAVISKEFGIIHATVQIQTKEGDCITCTDRLCRSCLTDEQLSVGGPADVVV